MKVQELLPGRFSEGLPSQATRAPAYLLPIPRPSDDMLWYLMASIQLINLQLGSGTPTHRSDPNIHTGLSPTHNVLLAPFCLATSCRYLVAYILRDVILGVYWVNLIYSNHPPSFGVFNETDPNIPCGWSTLQTSTQPISPRRYHKARIRGEAHSGSAVPLSPFPAILIVPSSWISRNSKLCHLLKRGNDKVSPGKSRVVR